MGLTAKLDTELIEMLAHAEIVASYATALATHLLCDDACSNVARRRAALVAEHAMAVSRLARHAVGRDYGAILRHEVTSDSGQYRAERT